MFESSSSKSKTPMESPVNAKPLPDSISRIAIQAVRDGEATGKQGTVLCCRNNNVCSEKRTNEVVPVGDDSVLLITPTVCSSSRSPEGRQA